MALRITVAGGLRFSDEAAVARMLSGMEVSAFLWNGENGASTFGYRWALSAGVPVSMFLRDRRRLLFWQSVRDRDGRLICEGRPDLVILFPPWSDAAEMIKQSTDRGIRLRYVS